MDYITIGEILKAQGIKGEIKVKALTDDITRFKKLKVVYIDNKPYQINTARFDSGYVFLSLLGVVDRNAAELLRGKNILIDKVNAVSVSPDSFFISDIIGCRLHDENDNFIGEMTEVLQLGAADVFVARQASGKELRFPFLKKLFTCMDVEGKKLIVIKRLLDEVCVYDD